ncbi:FHA domain-containing protein [Lentzea tibetensis]|uniref:FHA domain-containing protein n=1 Tax=Lentzea tibetensis TaxID=2591470 RepID=A0A563F2T3_9PSEU|nr:FHA domain-containing protein [Lentzea tibetensis]TWP54061.1 FHA domain-containing protein [Lentzea tibetensis]
MTAVEYVPGTWVAVVGAKVWLLLGAPPDAEVVRRCWDLVREDAELDDVLGAIVHEGFRAVGSFALVTPRRAVVRGGAGLVCLGADGQASRIDATGVMTWVDRNLDESIVQLRLTTGGTGPVLPLLSGVVLAAELVVSLGTVPEAVREEAGQEVVATTIVRSVPEPEPESRAVPAPQPEPARVTELLAQEPGGFIASIDWAAPVPAPAPAPGRAEMSETVLRTRVVTQDDTSMLISERGSGAPQVRAVKCQDQHLNPEAATHCRLCGGAVPAQTSFVAVRPPLGVLRLSTGDTITLDRNVVLGRDPHTDDRGNRANLVKVGDSTDISRNHVEVRLDGWDVLVVDLGSKNGTTMTQPGWSPQELAGHIPAVLCPGTRVTLSEDAYFTYEVASA